jgi:hypothetical protein
MSKVAVLVATCCLSLLGACVSNRPPPDLKYVYASDVINALKDELAEVESRPLNKEVEVPDGSCGIKVGNKTTVLVSVSFDSADVVLKTVATDSAAVTGTAAKVPLGAVLVGGSASFTRTAIRTQQVTYSLGPDPFWSPPARQSPFPEPAKNQPYEPPAGGQLTLHDVPIAPPSQRAASPPTTHGIAEALFAARDQFLAIDHARKPCLLPTKVKVQIDFQVQQKSDIKSDVGFLVFADVGGERISQRETANSLIVTFSLKGSSGTVN